MRYTARYVIVTFALLAWGIQTEIGTPSSATALIATANAGSPPPNNCTSDEVPSELAVWCGTFEGSWYLTGNFSGLVVDAIVRKPDGSIAVYGEYHWKYNWWPVGDGRRSARIMGNQLILDHPRGGRSTYTLRGDGKITHLYCRNREKRCLLTSQMATLKRVP